MPHLPHERKPHPHEKPHGEPHENPHEDPHGERDPLHHNNPFHSGEHAPPSEGNKANEKVQHDQNEATRRATELNNKLLENPEGQHHGEEAPGHEGEAQPTTTGSNVEPITGSGKIGIPKPEGVSSKLPKINAVESKAIRRHYAADEKIKASGSASEKLAENGFYITPENLKKLLNDVRYHDKFTIVDLRSLDPAVGDVTTLQIPNAEHFELKDSMQMYIRELGWPDKSSSNNSRTAEQESRVEKNWEKMMDQPPFTEIRKKSLVIFHCTYSADRTPAFASAYLRYAQQSGQQVALLQGGFAAWKTMADKDPNSKQLLADWKKRE